MKYIKLTAFVSLAFAMMGLAACTDKVDYDPIEAPTGQEVYFPQNGQTEYALQPDQTSVDVEILRQNAAGALNVGLTYTATADGEATDIFSVPASVSFPDGAKSAVVTINFDFSDITPETEYSVTLHIEGEDRSPYGPAEQTVSFTYAPWEEWQLMDGDGVYSPAFFNFGAAYVEVPIYTRKSLLNPAQVQYMIPGLYDEDLIINYNSDTRDVTVPRFSTGVEDADEMIYGMDSYTVWSTLFHSSNFPPENYPSTYDPERGLFTLSITYYTPEAGPWGPVTEFVQLPGFADLNVYFATSGTFIDENSVEYTMVNITKSNDVNSFAYTFKYGDLTDEEVETIVEEMKANENPELQYASGTFKFPVTEDGYYTLVTVGYDASNTPVCDNVFRFRVEISQKDWNAGWTSLGQVRYTDAFFYYYYGLTTWMVEIQESNETPGLFRLVKPYASAPFADEFDVASGHYYLQIDATDPDAVYIDTQMLSIGYYVGCFDTGTYADGKITFPAGSLAYYDNGWYADCEEAATIVNFNAPTTGDEDLEPSVQNATRRAHKLVSTKAPAKRNARMTSDEIRRYTRVK